MRSGVVLAVLGLAAPGVALAEAAPPKPAPQAPAKPAAVGEVVVTGQAPPVQTSIDRKSYNVSNDLRAQTGSISDALRNVPSVEVDVQGNVSLRGDSNVTILVDGKPSTLFQGESRSQALQSLPADRIDRVEVITNPSAEFRAEGTAGIINLITKTAKGAGRTVSARLTAGNEGQVFGSGSLGYNSKGMSLSADGFFRHDLQKQETIEDRLNPGPIAAHIETVGHSDFNIVGGRLGADYDLDPKTRISGELRGQYIDSSLDLLAGTTRDGPTGPSDFDRHATVDQQRGNGAASASLTRKFAGDGHQLKLAVSFDATEEDRTRDGGTLSRIPALPAAFDRQHVLTSYRQADAKGDYTRPMPDHAILKAGFDVQWDDDTFDNRGFLGPTSPAAIPAPGLTNLFEFQRWLYQGYATYERPVGDLTVLAGLRVEDTRLDLNQATLGQRVVRDDLKFYPSLHLAWTLNETQQLTASYSHRIQRPEPLAYNAFPFLIDPITYRSGSTDLEPQETHSFELGWQRRKAPSVLLATLYYRENFNGLVDVTRDLGGGAVLLRQENIAKGRSAGLEVVATGRLGPTLTYNISANGYWTEIDDTALGIPGTRSTVTLSGRANLSWQATPDDLVQVSGFLNGKRLTPQGYIEPSGMLNLGYRHKVNDRVSLVLSAQDVAATFGDHIVVETPALKSRIARDFHTRLLVAGVTWTFGGGKPRDAGFDFQQGGAPAPQ